MATPIPLIYQTLDHFEQFQRTAANMGAMVHARGWAALMSSSFISGADVQISPIDLLPYPQDVKGDSGRINNRTIRVLAKLIKDRRLPPHVIDAATDIEELRTIVERENLWQIEQD